MQQNALANDNNTKDSSSVPDISILKQEIEPCESNHDKKRLPGSLHDIEEEKSRTGSSNY